MPNTFKPRTSWVVVTALHFLTVFVALGGLAAALISSEKYTASTPAAFAVGTVAAILFIQGAALALDLLLEIRNATVRTAALADAAVREDVNGRAESDGGA